jgi:DmsE family decaheme c-type cytochrome
MGYVRRALMALAVMAGVCMTPASYGAEAVLPETGLGGGVGKAVAESSLKKDAVCTKCHDESENAPILSIYQTKHGVRADLRTPNCQSCHGESDRHIKGDPNVKGRAPPDVVFKKGVFKPSSAEAQSGACLACHTTAKRAMWEGSQHASRNLSCPTCHTVHQRNDRVLTKATQPEVCFACHKTERAQTHRISTHPIDVGKIACSDCHNPHGSTGPKLLAKNSVNETCYTCHAEKRGPFLWEHSPVIDDCSTCHTPHGSNTTPLLKARVPWLCQECHSGDHGAAINSGANLGGGNATTINGLQGAGAASPRAQVAARACLNCHSVIHGSNHPAGAKFQR